MHIGELAQRAQVNPKTVRYYETLGLLPLPCRDTNGYRRYAQPDLERLVFIKSAQRLGFSLDEIAEILSLSTADDQPCTYVRERLHVHLSSIAERINELRQIEDHLQTALATADQTSSAGANLCRIIEGHPVRQKPGPSPAA